MEENESKIVSFEAILKTYKSKKTSGLYGEREKLILNSPSKELKPQDVITVVSRQLRDIQKADCLKEERVSFTKMPKITEFVPVDLLQEQEASGQQHIHKFETQCVSDTQLIDIVDTVEAMVDGNRVMSEEFNATFCHKHDDLEEKISKEEDSPNIHLVNTKTISEDSNKVLTKYKYIIKPQAQSMNLKSNVLQKGKQDVYENIDEINTEICREFEISYCRTQNNNIEIAEINLGSEKAVPCVQDTTSGDTNYDKSFKNESKGELVDASSFCKVNTDVKKTVDDSSCVNNNIYSSIFNPAIIDENHKNCDNFKTEHDEKERSDFSDNIDCNSGTVTRNSVKEQELTCSPVWQNFKTMRNSPSPLVYTLDSFEKFESLAMPLIENSLDIESAKHLINSQIMNMELVIETNALPVLNKPKNSLMCDVDQCNEKVSNQNKEVCEVDCGKYDNVSRAQNTPEKIPVLVANECRTTTTKLQEVDQSQDGNVNQSENISKLEEDEILFSSDEESEYLNRSFDDLPLTCASKISSFETEVLDLEKTMFVGFQTGSNKSIQVCKDSFDKAKSIFGNINKLNEEDLKISELVDIYGSDIFNKNNNNMMSKDFSANVNDTSYETKIEILNDNQCDDITIPKEKTEWVGFKTANLKSINILDEALQNTNKVLNDAKDDMSHAQTATSRKRDFVGFKTASNKRIKLSDDSLAKSASVFKDIDLSYNFNLGNTHLKINEANKKIKIQDLKSAADEVDLLYNNEIVDKKDHLNMIDQATIQELEHDSIQETKKQDYLSSMSYECVGFKTASDKNIEISGLNVSDNILNDIQNNLKTDIKANFDPGIDKKTKSINHIQTPPNMPNFVGFKTANNKDIKISEEALAKTKSIFQDIGFENVSDKNVKPNSEDTIECLFSNDFVKENTLELNTETNSVNIAPHKKHNSSSAVSRSSSTYVFPKGESVLSKSERHLYPNIFESKNVDTNAVNNHEGTSTGDKKSPAIFKGFKTANKEIVKVSDEAIYRTKIIFQDIPNIIPCKDYLQKSKKGTDYINSLSKNNLEVQNSSEVLKNACYKHVKISEEALPKTVKVFYGEHESNLCALDKKELDYENNKHGYIKDTNDKIKAPQDLKPGSNKTAQIPGKSHWSYEKDSFQGFKTAGNRPVKVSEEAILKSKMIFKDIDILDSGNNSFTTSVDLKNSAQNFVEKPNDNEKEIHATFQGFKTASNKKVNISEKALAITKNIFKDIDFEKDISKLEKCDDIETACEILKDENIENNQDLKIFNGFQTASNKSVKVSEKAIARSRKIFEELDLDLQNGKNKLNIRHMEGIKREKGTTVLETLEVPLVIGFKTATNKPIKISEDSLKKSKKLLSELDNPKRQNIGIEEVNKLSANNAENDVINVDNILNTQLLNNFEESLHTEDFHEDSIPKQCKRSGSPILSCPKAKKRKKFETPYRNDMTTIKTPKVICKITENTDYKYVFSENYKKTKLYSLINVHNIDQSIDALIIDPYILSFDFDTFLNFEFTGSRNELTDVRWSTDDLKRCFTDSVNKKIIPDGWIDNHLRLILWKLISYEIRFPNAMKGVCSVRNVLEQLKYRYDKELYNVQRPALRKLLEKDDISTRTMVLAVVGTYVDQVRVDNVTNPRATPELLLTDGWYCIKTCIDAMLANLVANGRISVGMKIATVGAELMGCEQGISPWEDTSAVRLKIFGNSTRPAHWDAKLGYYTAGAMLSHLSSIKLTGGKVSKMRVFVARVYPSLYVQRFEDGSTVTRSERLENLHQMKYESERQLQLEKLYEKVEKEFYEQESSSSEGGDIQLKKSLQSGSQLYKNMMRSRDSNEFRSSLTHSQSALLENYTSKRHEEVLEALRKRVHERVQKEGLLVGRNVVPLLKIRVVGVEGKGEVVSKAMISIWRPSDAIFDVVKEGTWIDVFNVVPTAIRNSEVQISAGRQSVFHRSKYKESDKLKPHIELFTRKCFTTKELAQNPTITTDFNEVDTIGIVFFIEPSTKDFETSKSLFQNVYLTDIDKNFVCVNFWGGIKKFGYENIFDTGHTVACMNLQKRAGNTRKSIPQYRATEFSVFTKTPKLDNVRIINEDLLKQLSGLDKRKFCSDCVSIRNNYASIRQSTENISPYRFNISDHNITKNKMFIDSPLAQHTDINLNLTGLDFESTFKQTDTQDLSPARLQQKRRVNEKIERLKMYGEPPPLSKMHIINKSKNAGSAYKSPLTSDISNVARLKNLNDSPVTTNSKCQSSPILSMNRTYVVRSGVNPVKLNFSTASAGDEKNDSNPFAEEFDCSPPLSLDSNQV